MLNAVKHAAPHTVEVSPDYGPRALTLRVSDDGQGIAPGAIDAASAWEHWGMAGMRDRANRAGGRLDISSEPSRGTAVTLLLPIGGTSGTFTDHDG